MRKRSTAIVLVLAATAWSPAALAGAAGPGPAETARASAAIGADGFLSPDRKTWCSGTAKEVGCVSLPGPTSHGAIVKRGGKVILCPVGSAGVGWKCFQNFDAKAPVLHYGRRADVGGFTCASARQGITCTVRASGRGFRIDSEGVAQVP
jgi:hypothetical protein